MEELKNLVQWEAKMSPAEAKPGEHVRIIITGKIKAPWYTYSVIPQGEFAPPPTTVKFLPNSLDSKGPLYETNPIQKVDKVFKLPLAYHKKAVRLYQNFQVPETQKPGTQWVDGWVQYQTCNDEYCAPPQKAPLRAAFTTTSGPVREAYGFMERTVDFLDSDGTFKYSADSLEGALSGGLLQFLLLAAGFGLLALITPCVFPMIPVTVSFFTAESERNKSSVVPLALLFAGGMIITYTGAGLVLTFLLGASGVSQFATHPLVNVAVAVFFTFFAFNLLGVLQFALPSGVVQGLDQKSRMLKGPTGVLLMGVAFTATSFTCTVAFVGTLLIAATQGQVFWPLIGMIVFSTVFSLPFFLLALFPRYISKLRGKGGNWMSQVKVVLGAIELAAALKFLSNADLIWQWGVIDREVVLIIWALLAGLTAGILLGIIPWPEVEITRPKLPQMAGGVLFLAVGGYLALGASGKALDNYTEAYMPPSLEAGGGLRSSGEYLSTDKVHNLPWHNQLGPALAKAKKTRKPVFVDFTGYTCINCRWMEKEVFAEKSVFQSLEKDFVLAQLYTDGGKFGEENQQLQIKRFQTIALPYYVVLSPDNAVLARHGGIMPKPSDFLNWLNQARKQLKPKQTAKK